MSARGLGLAAIALGALAGPAAAEPRPCTGCVRAVPDAPVAMIVVLHGDDAGASSVLADLRAAAAAAHVALFAPQCPRALGCDGSWWRWALTDAHDPAWLEEQIAAAAAAAHATRVALAGYSGGASYLASWAPAHAAPDARVAFLSGGYVATDTCPAAALHALIVIGDEDDMRATYVAPFARWLGGCAHADVTSRVVPHLGHHEMHGALRGPLGAEVVSWLVGESPHG